MLLHRKHRAECRWLRRDGERVCHACCGERGVVGYRRNAAEQQPVLELVQELLNHKVGLRHEHAGWSRGQQRTILIFKSKKLCGQRSIRHVVFGPDYRGSALYTDMQVPRDQVKRQLAVSSVPEHPSTLPGLGPTRRDGAARATGAAGALPLAGGAG